MNKIRTLNPYTGECVDEFESSSFSQVNEQAQHGHRASHPWGVLEIVECTSDNAQNVISDRARFGFEVRGGNDRVCDELLGRAAQCIEGAAGMQCCRTSVRETSRFEVRDNHPALVESLRETLCRAGVPEAAIRTSHLAPGTGERGRDQPVARGPEKRRPGTGLLIGCDSRGGHHNPSFDFDEDLLTWTAEILRASPRPA